MNKKQIAVIFWGYLVLLLIVSAAPWSTSQRIGPQGFSFRIDYFFHLGIYFGLTILYFLWQFSSFVRNKLSIIISHISLLLIFSFLTEAIQLFIPFRSFNIKDFIANAMGVLLAVSIYIIFKKFIVRVANRYLILK